MIEDDMQRFAYKINGWFLSARDGFQSCWWFCEQTGWISVDIFTSKAFIHLVPRASMDGICLGCRWTIVDELLLWNIANDGFFLLFTVYAD